MSSKYNGERQRAVVTRVCLGLVVSSLAMAQPATDPPLKEVRSWTLGYDDLVTTYPRTPAYRLHIEMALVQGTRWMPDVILEAAGNAAAILAQCGIQVSGVRLHEFEGPDRYRYLSTPESREFARAAGLRKPAIFFVEDTRQRPAFDAEAIGRANARTRPEMADTVWITAGIRDLSIALAHELVHVLGNSGEHSDAPDNLMREDTAPENTHLTADQCGPVVQTGRANGLIDRAAPDEPER